MILDEKKGRVLLVGPSGEVVGLRMCEARVNVQKPGWRLATAGDLAVAAPAKPTKPAEEPVPALVKSPLAKAVKAEEPAKG